MKFFVNGKLACNREAIYGKDGNGIQMDGRSWETIDRYTPCDSVRLKAGDKVWMSSDYDLTKHNL